ncbi:hypothetical protein SAMN05892877_105301 [Rhizobium subbaraonis]|uniref:Uncharacterized protein n=1 Tax=Rhizobium subbaraonis TaxID=908946 RepID=A0A285UAC8_9HYPH|nr:hypothetical protein [Rhizobium subbaraonis]SOC38864.1 hypothetical protein SAMN05892877_105301 [Rhizobium subbaraonis]
MKAALIVMTILGCDDSVTQCHYIDTVDTTWQTVALCDAQSEAQITRYQNSNYPVVVAVCETNGNQHNADAQEDVASSPDSQAASAPTPTLGTETPATDAGLASRTLTMLRQHLPDAPSLRETVAKPFRYAEDGYSWVVRKFSD